MRCVEDDMTVHISVGEYTISLIIISFIYMGDVACYCDEANNPMQ